MLACPSGPDAFPVWRLFRCFFNHFNGDEEVCKFIREAMLWWAGEGAIILSRQDALKELV